jgi:hypothetical protein
MTGPPATRCTSPRCSTGSSRTWAAISATTSSTSPPSNLRSGSPPHVHIALRGTVSRAELRRVLVTTYHQVWWSDTSTVQYDGDELPVWDEHTGNYLDPATGELLPAGAQALDTTGQDTEPHHVARFGIRFDARACSAGPRTPGAASATWSST